MDSGYYVGFSVSPNDLVSFGIRVFTRSDISHVFLLSVSRAAERVYHVDDGRFETIDLTTFTHTRVVKRLYKIPVRDERSMLKALRWFLVSKAFQRRPRPLHTWKMALEWATRRKFKEWEQIHYCTQAVSDFLRMAHLPHMPHASQRVVCPRTFESWIKALEWEQVHG